MSKTNIQIGHKVDGADNYSVLKQAMSQPDFHRAYLTAAGCLYADFKGRDSSRNEDALPVFFLQRHALELLIKDCLGIVYQLMLVEYELGYRGDPPSECKLVRASKDHKLEVLSKDLKAVLFFDDDSDSEGMLRLETLVAKMHSVDPRSTWSRYPKINPKTYEIEYINPTVLDLKFYQQEIEGLSDLLLGDSFGWTGALMEKYQQVWHERMRDLHGV